MEMNFIVKPGEGDRLPVMGPALFMINGFIVEVSCDGPEAIKYDPKGNEYHVTWPKVRIGSSNGIHRTDITVDELKSSEYISIGYVGEGVKAPTERYVYTDEHKEPQMSIYKKIFDNIRLSSSVDTHVYENNRGYCCRVKVAGLLEAAREYYKSDDIDSSYAIFDEELFVRSIFFSGKRSSWELNLSASFGDLLAGVLLSEDVDGNISEVVANMGVEW